MGGSKQQWIRQLSLNAFLYISNYISYIMLVEMVCYSIFLLLFIIVGTSWERPILTVLSGPYKDVHIAATTSNIKVVADSKDITRNVSLILLFIPLVFGILFELIKKLLHIKINVWYADITIILLWVLGAVILAFKIKGLFVPFSLLLISVFCLVLFTMLKLLTDYLKGLLPR